MIESLLSIKLCLALVFLIGLITGLLYVMRVSKEEYLPVIKKYNEIINKNHLEERNIYQENEKLNQDILKMRTSIKTQKEQTSVVENNLLDTEYLFLSLQDSNEKLQKQIHENRRVIKSLNNEYNYYKDKIEKEKNIIHEIQNIKKSLQSKTIEKNVLEEELDNLKKDETHMIAEIKKLLLDNSQKKPKQNELKTKVYIEEQNLKNNKNFKKMQEYKKYYEKLEEYKKRLREISNGL